MPEGDAVGQGGAPLKLLVPVSVRDSGGLAGAYQSCPPRMIFDSPKWEASALISSAQRLCE